MKVNVVCEKESVYEDVGVNTDGAPRFFKLENEIWFGGLIYTLADLGQYWRKCFRQQTDRRLNRSSSIERCPLSNIQPYYYVSEADSVAFFR